MTSTQHPFGVDPPLSTEDQAEDTLVRVLEERRASANFANHNSWDPAVPGEEPPLLREVPRGLNDKEQRTRVSHLRDIGMRVLAMKKAKKWSSSTQRNMIDVVADHHVPRRQDTGATLEPQQKRDDDQGNFFEGVGGGEEVEVGVSHLAAADTDADRLITGAFVVDKLLTEDDDQSIITEFSDSVGNEETLPLTGKLERPNLIPFGNNYGTTPSSCKNKQKKRKRFIVRGFKRLFRSHIWWALRPSKIKRGVQSFLLGRFFFGILPLLSVAAFLYYPLGNPSPENFMESSSFSYWFVFGARQLVTLTLAAVTEYLLVDMLALHSRTTVKLLGPFMTLFVIQAKGWPLQAVLWALWDLFILFGDNAFDQNWFYFTDIELFSKANPGGDFLTSEFYFRAIIAVLVAGLATAAKRTVMAMSFGKRTLQRYKARLEKLLVDVLIVSEVAELSKEIERMDENQDNTALSRGNITTKWGDLLGFDEANKRAVSFGENDEEDDSQSNCDDDNSDASVSINRNEEDQAYSNFEQRKYMRPPFSVETSSVTMFGIKAMLDRWKEPVNKLDQAIDPSIHDILQFRKAITFVDGRRPFSRSFGPASTRDECIKSAEETFKRLMIMSPGERKLSFSVLSVLATDNDGVPDQKKMNQLRRVFRPDRHNELSMLAFVQSYDTIYRKLRYFRASVGNNSVIDKVLGEGLDKLFYFLLLLVVVVVMQYNPWTLLVSMSTLIVSFAFAVGPSASKYIEGLLLIAVRRPYDLGDRILMVSPDNVINHGPGFSWLVEDINLFSTTLRFAATNEVSSVNNGSIAGLRIVNCARSPNALITLTLKLSFFVTDDQASVLREAITTYVKDRPRTWVQVILFRSDDLDPDNAFINYLLCVQHRKTWQDASAIYKDQAELLKFSYKMGEKLKVLYDSPMRRIRLYRPGESYIKHEEHLEHDGSSKLDATPKKTSMANALAAAGLDK